MLESVLLGFLLFFNPIRCQKKKLESFVSDGQLSDIEQFPFSAFLKVSCGRQDPWICGASILNQNILLTAAHCVDGCDKLPSRIIIRCGNANRNRGLETFASKSISHEKYRETLTEYDIGLIKSTDPLKFSSNIARVAIMKAPPYGEKGQIAGWGLSDEVRNIPSEWLKHTPQKIMKREICQNYVGTLPQGVICGGSVDQNSYASVGDSGSALVVWNYIQVGIVSFKRQHVSRSVSMYTDVGYYYNWIKENALALYCKT